VTEVEAVERILAGSPYTQCAPCLGTGKVSRIDEATASWELCKSCEGCASYADPAYAEACRILDRPFPPNELGFFLRTRNMLDVHKLRADALYLPPDLMKDIP
jgi:hypothetical protein